MQEISEGLRLLFDTTTPAASASMLVQWCITPELIEQLREHGVENPHLFIVTVDDYDRELYYLVPLHQMQKLLQFHRAGVHEIHATIVWNTSGNTNRFRNSWSDPSNIWNGYYGLDPETDERAWIKNHNHERGERMLDTRRDGSSHGYARREVSVDAGFFGKEPAAWEKRWLTLLTGGRAFNECHIRRQRLFAYSIQPPVVLAIFLLFAIVRSVVALLYLSVGTRDLNYRAIVSPFAMNWRDVYEDAVGGKNKTISSFFLQRKDRSFRRLAVVWFFLMPATLVGLFAFDVIWQLARIILTDAATMADFSWTHPFLFAVILPVIALFLGATSAIIMLLVGVIHAVFAGTSLGHMFHQIFQGAITRIGALAGRVDVWWRDRAERAHKAREDRFSPEEYAKQFEGVACDGRTGARIGRDLSVSLVYRPVLIFEKLKYKICKPLQQ